MRSLCRKRRGDVADAVKVDSRSAGGRRLGSAGTRPRRAAAGEPRARGTARVGERASCGVRPATEAAGGRAGRGADSTQAAGDRRRPTQEDDERQQTAPVLTRRLTIRYEMPV